MGAPILRALKALKEGKQGSEIDCDLSYRKKEKMWIRGDADKLTFVYSVHFDDKIDRNIAPLMLSEF